MQYAALAIFAALALAGAWSDIARRTIPNLLSLLLLVLGLSWSVIDGGWQALLGHGGHFLIALAAGMALFAIRAWGGGDAKFYPAIAAWIPIDRAVALAVAIAIIGGGLVGIYALARRFSKQRPDAPLTLPYGVAIAAGGLFVQVQMLLS